MIAKILSFGNNIFYFLGPLTKSMEGVNSCSCIYNERYMIESGSIDDDGVSTGMEGFGSSVCSIDRTARSVVLTDEQLNRLEALPDTYHGMSIRGNDMIFDKREAPLLTMVNVTFFREDDISVLIFYYTPQNGICSLLEGDMDTLCQFLAEPNLPIEE